jgi:hypothetical protein
MYEIGGSVEAEEMKRCEYKSYTGFSSRLGLRAQKVRKRIGEFFH